MLACFVVEVALGCLVLRRAVALLILCTYAYMYVYRVAFPPIAADGFGGALAMPALEAVTHTQGTSAVFLLHRSNSQSSVDESVVAIALQLNFQALF